MHGAPQSASGTNEGCHGATQRPPGDHCLSSADSEEGSSRRSSGFGGWSTLRWVSKLSGSFGFGAVTSSGSGRGSGSGSRASGISGYSPSQQDFECNFDDLADPEIFFEWLTGYDDRFKSEVATWLRLQHMGSDFCSHSRDLCNRDLVNQVAATLI